MARKRINVFNLSFLDVMACGLGAIILFYMIINAQIASRAAVVNVELQAETDLLEEEVLRGRKNLIRVRNTLESKQQEQVTAEGEASRLQEILEELRIELAKLQNDSSAEIESVEKLRADVERLEQAQRQLASKSDRDSSESGRQVRAYGAGGNRQYLTGMRMGGKRVLILIDTSGSMLGRTYVSALRFRAMPDGQKRRAPKWRQAVDTVDWLTSQMGGVEQFQLYGFNENADSLMDGTDGEWVDVSETELTGAVDKLRSVTPDKGTSLFNALRVVAEMQPLPDNVYLLTDGLPTQGKTPPPAAELVKPGRRVKFFKQAVNELPKKVPVNVLLFPMDGDPEAAVNFWDLAASTKGSFMSPSRDWP
jgi:hypothetical protein